MFHRVDEILKVSNGGVSQGHYPPHCEILMDVYVGEYFNLCAISKALYLRTSYVKFLFSP